MPTHRRVSVGSGEIMAEGFLAPIGPCDRSPSLDMPVRRPKSPPQLRGEGRGLASVLLSKLLPTSSSLAPLWAGLSALCLQGLSWLGLRL